MELVDWWAGYLVGFASSWLIYLNGFLQSKFSTGGRGTSLPFFAAGSA
jgi:hypothetical protein